MDKSKKNLFTNRAYITLLSAQTVSALGDWLDILAILTLVAIKWNASPLAITGIMLCLAIPSIFLGSFAGSIADRFDRKRIMIISNIFCAFLIVLVAFSNSLWQVYVLISLKSIFEVFFMPAKNGMLKEVVKQDDLQMAISISSMIDNAAKIIGPTVGGVLVATVGIKWAFYIDGITFILSAILLLGIPKSTLISQNAVKKKFSFKTVTADFKEGFQIIKDYHIILVSLFLFSSSLLVLQIADTQFMVLARQMIQDPTIMVGYAMAASGIGMFLSAAVLSKLKHPTVIVTTSVGSIGVGLAFSIAALLNGISESFIVFVFPFLCFLGGVSFGLASIPFQVYVQKTIPVTMTGRVFGTIGSVTTLSAFIGMISGGILSTLIGVVLTFILSGGILITIGIVMLLKKNRFESREIHVTESNGGLQGEA